MIMVIWAWELSCRPGHGRILEQHATALRASPAEAFFQSFPNSFCWGGFSDFSCLSGTCLFDHFWSQRGGGRRRPGAGLRKEEEEEEEEEEQQQPEQEDPKVTRSPSF